MPHLCSLLTKNPTILSTNCPTRWKIQRSKTSSLARPSRIQRSSRTTTLGCELISLKEELSHNSIYTKVRTKLTRNSSTKMHHTQMTVLLSIQLATRLPTTLPVWQRSLPHLLRFLRSCFQNIPMKKRCRLVTMTCSSAVLTGRLRLRKSLPARTKSSQMLVSIFPPERTRD